MDQYKDVISIKDIAKIAGVSTATVSRVLNKNGGYSKQTEERVQNIINEYGYVSNIVAKSIRVSKSFTIGLILPDIKNEFFSTLASAIESYFYKRHYSVFICNTSGDKDKEIDYFKRLESQTVAGIIDISSLDIIPENIVRKNIPTLFLDRIPLSKKEYLTVKSNDYQGICDSTQLLIDNGCKNILYIQTDLTVKSKGREAAFKDTLIKNNMLIKNENIIRGDKKDPSNVQGEIAVSEYIKSGQIPDGIVCPNDSLALGAMYAVRRAGLKIPDDVQIIGFDNTLQSKITSPSISSVTRNPELLAEKAAEMIMNAIDNKEIKNKHIELETHIIKRETTK